jgi:tRNA-dihydrouridine synthase
VSARTARKAERLDALERHLKLQVDHFGELSGIREMRKFYRWYLRSFEGAKRYRPALTSLETYTEVAEIIPRMREEIEENGRGAAQIAS